MPVLKKVLVVAEKEDISFLSEKFLQLEKYDPITCNNGYDALNIIEEKHDEIVLVLLDIMLPGMSGYEVLTKIKAKYPKIFVVLFTVKFSFEDIQKGKDLGADGYLVKDPDGYLVKDPDGYFAKILKRGDSDDDRYPYPYVFKPPSSPDDLALAARAQLRQPPKKKDSEEKIPCQYCGMELTKEEQLTHSCQKKPKTM